jgi:hypothetical protein
MSEMPEDPCAQETTGHPSWGGLPFGMSTAPLTTICFPVTDSDWYVMRFADADTLAKVGSRLLIGAEERSFPAPAGAVGAASDVVAAGVDGRPVKVAAEQLVAPSMRVRPIAPAQRRFFLCGDIEFVRSC